MIFTCSEVDVLLRCELRK